ncbi:MAG: hypothetical protein PHI12_08760 [Dehalococcoidales bacterium]|nr:hypothetical protein [Dehalococcoidales bacterium]
MANERPEWINVAMQAVDYQIDREFDAEPIKTIGEIVLLLKQQPQDNKVVLDFDDSYDVFRLVSYRGYYRFLSLDYDCSTKFQRPYNTVSQLLRSFEGAINSEFGGYKGGQFKMHSKTIVFVSPYGMASQRMLVDIKTKGKLTTICTKIHVEEDNG